MTISVRKNQRDASKSRRVSIITKTNPSITLIYGKQQELKYMREKGLCQRCHTFVFGRRAHVHHIIPIAKDTSLKLEVNNLMLLCPQCHAIVENESDDKKKSVFPSFFKT